MNMWDERYKAHDTVYGVRPNVFWASRMASRPAGGVCLPCRCEKAAMACGRPSKRWDVHAFDLEGEVRGCPRPMNPAQARGVEVTARVADAMTVEFARTVDVVGLVFAHMPPGVARGVPPTGVVLGEARRPSRGGGVSPRPIGL